MVLTLGQPQAPEWSGSLSVCLLASVHFRVAVKAMLWVAVKAMLWVAVTVMLWVE